MRHLVAPFFHRALFVLLAILPGAASAQTAVPRWEDLYRPASPPPIAYSAGIASREIADGSILVVTDQFICIRFDHDGNTLSAIPLPISTRVVPNEGADSKRPRSGDAPNRDYGHGALGLEHLLKRTPHYRYNNGRYDLYLSSPVVQESIH